MSIQPDSASTMITPSATPSQGSYRDQITASVIDDNHTLQKLRDAIGSMVQTRDTLLQIQKDDKGPQLHYESMIQTCNTMGVPLAKLAHEWGCTDDMPSEWLSATANYPHHPETRARRTQMTLSGFEWIINDLNNRTQNDKEYQATLQHRLDQTHTSVCSSSHTKATNQPNQDQIMRNSARDLDRVPPVFMTDREMREFLAEDHAAEFRPRISGTVHSGVYAEHFFESESSRHPGAPFTPHYTETSPNVEDTHSAGFWDDWTPRQAAEPGEGERGQTHQNQAPIGFYSQLEALLRSQVRLNRVDPTVFLD